MQSIESTAAIAANPQPQTLPALFIGHGSPLHAVDDTEFSRAWRELGKVLPKPAAILCISAHWETRGTRITAMAQPKTIHDFYGFPPALFQVNYPAPGDPVLALRIAEALSEFGVQPDPEWGLDHGSWAILRHLYPLADVPVLQLSLDRDKTPAQHYRLGQALRWLRRDGVLILGSGNVVHNLRAIGP